MPIKQADPIPEEELKPLHDMLTKITVRKIGLAAHPRNGFPEHRSMTFGLTRHRYGGRELKPSWASKKYPKIHDEVFRIGETYCPHPFTSVHLNHNVSCPPHVDGNNNGESTIISLGGYVGGKLVVEGETVDAYCRPTTFDGNLLMHWNTPDLVGNKYSLVFFRM